MGCRVSKDDIAEPQPIQSHRHEKFKEIGKDILKPNQVINTRESTCISSLYISSTVLTNPSLPPSVFIHTNLDTPSSDDEDKDEDKDNPNFEFPLKLSIVEELDDNESRTTALAALSGKEAVTSKEHLEERIKTILATNDEVLSKEQSDKYLTCPLGILATDNEVFNVEQSEECLTCPLGILSEAAILQAFMSRDPSITQQYLGDDLGARVCHEAMISEPEPSIRWNIPLHKGEIIDFDEEPDVGDQSLLLENTLKQLEDQSDQEKESVNYVSLHDGSESSASLSEEQSKQDQKLDDVVNTNKALSNIEPQKTKLPPLTIIPPIQEFEGLSARTPTLALDSADHPPNGVYHDMRMDLPMTDSKDEVPTSATKNLTSSGWRSLHCDLTDLHIEDIVLLESHELDNFRLIPTLDWQGIHMDNKDVINPSLQLIS